jgi:hypothetical protein
LESTGMPKILQHKHHDMRRTHGWGCFRAGCSEVPAGQAVGGARHSLLAERIRIRHIRKALAGRSR